MLYKVRADHCDYNSHGFEHLCESKEIALKLREILIGKLSQEEYTVTVSIHHGMDEKELKEFLENSILQASRDVDYLPSPESLGFSGMFKSFFALPSSPNSYTEMKKKLEKALNKLGYLEKLKEEWRW
jgi:hypothetical protein